MKKWISFPKTQGIASRQAHVALPPGTFEREAGREGFFGPATHFHHRHPPTAWTAFEGDLRPRAFDLNLIDKASDCPWGAMPLLGNNATHLRYWLVNGNMKHLVRNADGDDLLFFHSGGGDFYCDYGHLRVVDGDYLLVPRGTTWRIDALENTSVLMIEATGDSYRLPEKGILGPHALFDQGVLDVPQIDEAFEEQQDDDEWRVSIKRNGSLSTQIFPFNPLDTIGWHGDLAPVRINWRDIRPLVSMRYHLPPSAHTTFVSSRFVVCTFVPRPIESDPQALKLPFYHSNDDFDELVFYHKGQFFSRDNIHPGMVTYHPSGFAHGPHPKAYQAAQEYSLKETEEVAVMVDTRDPMSVSDLPARVEWEGYVDSWKSD